MKLISVTIRQYKVHEYVHIDFDAARNVIGAPNESGKSTIVEAIHHALFLRSRVTGLVQKAMLSEVYSGYPTVELRFEIKQVQYTITKIFSGGQSASTTLQQHSSGGRTLRNEEAEEMIHDLLQTEEIGGGRNLDARLRMQWAHLWIWQGTATEDPLDHANIDQHATILRNRLAQIEGGGVLESALDATVSSVIKHRHHATFTEKGKPRSGSSLDHAHKGLQSAVLRHEQAQKMFNVLEDSLEVIRCSKETIATCDTQQKSLSKELEDVLHRQQIASDLKVSIAEEQAALVYLQDQHAEALRSDKAMTDCQKEIHVVEERIGPKVSTLDNLQAHEREYELRLGQATTKLSEAGQRQVDANAKLAIYDSCEKYEILCAERKALSHRCDQITQQRKELKKLYDEQDCVPEISNDALSELLQYERLCEITEATLEAIATKIELLQASNTVTLRGKELVLKLPITISSDAELIIESDGQTPTKMRVSPGGGRSLAEAMQGSQDAKMGLKTALTDAGFDSIDAARKAHARRQSLDADIHAIRLAIDGLGGAEAESDLKNLDAQLRKTATELHHRTPEKFTQPKNLTSAQEKKQSAEQVLREACDVVARTSEEVEVIRKQLSDISQQRMLTEERLHEEKTELASLNARLHIMKERFGSDRQSRIQELAHQVYESTEKLKASQKRLSKLLPEDLERDRQRLERARSLLFSKQQEAETAKQVARAKLDFGGTNDPRADLAQSAVHYDLAIKEHARAFREAESVKLLAKLFLEKKQEVESQFVAPLTNRVRDYLMQLYGEDAAVSVDYTDGCFHRLSLSHQQGNTVTFEFSQLSSGAKEQVSAAFRLAMAEVLAQDHDGCLPIIFDDAFVNADMDRQRAIQRLLDLAASRGLQVIVLSCRPENYVNLGAKQISLDTNPFVKVRT